MSGKIKNLLFDLGGVIIDLNRQRCIDAFDALGLQDAASYFGEYVQQGPFMQLERGDISPAQLHDMLRPHFSRPVSDADMDRAFCLFLVGIPARRLEQLRELRKRYRIFLLSNTNAIMWDTEIARMFRVEGYCREDYFDGMVTSFAAHMLKPDPALFDYTAREMGIQPGETLFLDDSLANVEAARRCGYLATHVTTDRGFMKAIQEFERNGTA